MSSKKRDIVAIQMDKVEKLNNLEKYKTAIRKKQFINELKVGLGDEIKNNPNRVKVGKSSWVKKLGLMIKKIFTKF